jgi:hypothetical protein
MAEFFVLPRHEVFLRFSQFLWTRLLARLPARFQVFDFVQETSSAQKYGSMAGLALSAGLWVSSHFLWKRL